MMRRDAIRQALEIHANGFVWGRSDCCQFARTVVEAIEQRVLAFPWYDTEEAAEDIIGAAGGLENLVTGVIGRGPELSGYEPQDGDVTLVVMPDAREAMGVWVNGHPICIWEHGHSRVPKSWSNKTWKVG